jgi:hypothetical protein
MSTEITGFLMVMALVSGAWMILRRKIAIASSADIGHYSTKEPYLNSNAIDIISLTRCETQNTIAGGHNIS